ncbi:MAG TPA: hypothetical protein VJB94_04360 [Candidatus Nanoarchaeia archaeon]|nr:hypothetical protein [Candidatus Nanoarchaeia archaeon]
MNKKAQASTEYIFLIAIILIVFIPVLYYSINKVNNEVKLSKVNEMVISLRQGIKNIYSFGPNNLEVVLVNIPAGINSVSISGKEIIFKFEIYGQVSDVIVDSPAQLVGNLSIKPGTHNILINNTNGSLIRLTDKEFLQ